MQKLLISKTNTQKLIIKILLSILVCVMSFGFLISVFSLIILRFDTPQYILIPITTGILIFASFLDSFILAKLFKENGLFIGVFVSFVFVVLFIVCAVLSDSLSFTNIFFTKIISILLAGTLGGIAGVSL